ncbi:MAG: acyl-CoA dehydrogenase [Myxococcaceae bacterium]|nr:acyl-CoA dehydrogenase [Myxococcaceae bacterium]
MTPDANAAAVLEQALGDAADPNNPFGWHQALALDEREAFPETLAAELARQGLLLHFIPKADGGRLGSITEAALLMRAAARRDLTAAIALGQAFLGSVPVWLRGSAGQRGRQAEALSAGRLAALALTEEAHGSDLLATETRARDGRLTGAKWLINNATRAELVTVLARTNDREGLGALTLVHLDKRVARGFTPLARLATHGIRGADISGLAFDGAGPVSHIGNDGSGMALVLEALQVTRIGCAAFSLGAADTALRLALDFAQGRKLYGATAFEIPHVRAVLTTAFLDLLIAEAVAVGAWRGLHTDPGQMSLASAVTKYFVPTRCEQLIRDVAVVFGARHWLRSGPFQKLMRDASVVSLFDGSTAVNLEGIVLQLSRLKPATGSAARLARRFDTSSALEPFTGNGLELMGPGFDDVLDARLPELEVPDRSQRRTAAAFELAQRAASLYAAESFRHLHPAWAELAAERLTQGRLIDAAAPGDRLLALHREKRWFSHFAIPLH